MNDPAGTAPDLGALSLWAPELARTFVSLASDIALVIDGSGVIRDVAQGPTEPIAPGASDWIGRPWADTVSLDTRLKVEHLLSEVSTRGIARRREVNHTLTAGASLPVAYTAVRLGVNGPVLAVGRDLRSIAAIQQRFIDSQQDLERSYWKARQAESHYRLLFQVATDAVLVIDPQTLLILEANQAAARLFDCLAEQMTGRHATFGFESRSRSAMTELLTNARSTGQTGEIRARLLASTAHASVAATAFRSGDTTRLLVRVRSTDAPPALRDPSMTLARPVLDAQDGVVVTDSSGRVLVANPAFVRLMNLPDEAAARGRHLSDWLGQPDRPLMQLVAQVRRDGLVRRSTSWARPTMGGAALPVEVSAVLLTEGDQECIGFTVHPVATDTSADAAALPGALTEGLASLAAQVGVLPLSDVLREATALLEQHFRHIAARRAASSPDGP